MGSTVAYAAVEVASRDAAPKKLETRPKDFILADCAAEVRLLQFEDQQMFSECQTTRERRAVR